MVKTCGVYQSVVSEIKKKMQHNSTGTQQCKGRCGRMRISSEQDDRAVVRFSKRRLVKSSGRLYIVGGVMKTQQYKKMVENCLMPQLQYWFPTGNCVFM